MYLYIYIYIYIFVYVCAIKFPTESIAIHYYYKFKYDYMVKSHEMDSLLKLFFSNPNGIFTCYSMYRDRQSIKVMDDNLHS